MKFTFRTLRNPTKTDLTFTWDSEAYLVHAGGEEMFPDFIAGLGARKLADREHVKEANKVAYIASVLGEKKDTQEPLKTSFREEVELAKKQLEPEPVKEFEDLEKLDKPWCDKCDSKGGRHKKDCPNK
jgi:hypothetical protein